MTRTLALALGLLCISVEADARKPIVAVFGIENQGTALTPEVVDRLTIYLASKLTESGAYEVVPQDKLKEALVAKKKDSFKQCYAQSCQIEVGQELAANRALSTQLMKVGSACLVALNLYDLRTSTSARAATGRGGCDEDAIMGSIDGAFAKLTAGAGPVAKPSAPPPEPVKPIAGVTPPSSPPPPPPVDAPRSTPFYKKWWFWTLIGVAVVGVTVGVVVGTQQSSSSGGSTTGGLIQF